MLYLPKIDKAKTGKSKKASQPKRESDIHFHQKTILKFLNLPTKISFKNSEATFSSSPPFQKIITHILDD